MKMIRKGGRRRIVRQGWKALFMVFLFLLPGTVLPSSQGIPPIVTTTVAPNVMIILDNSGSMEDGETALSYPPNAVYAIAEKMYCSSYFPFVFLNSACKHNVIQIADDKDDAPDRWLPNLPGLRTVFSGFPFFYSEYRYNPTVFIPLSDATIHTIQSRLSRQGAFKMTLGKVRWIFFKGSWGAANSYFDNPDKKGRLSKITVAKWSVSKLVMRASDVQFGVMTFLSGCKKNSGAKVIFPCTDLTKDYDKDHREDKEDLLNYVNSIYPDTCTPLANALYEACCYFGGSRSSCRLTDRSYASNPFRKKIMKGNRYISPIAYWCQKSFVILVTDGESYQDGGNVPGSFKDYDHDGNVCDGTCWVSTGWHTGYYKSDSLDDVALYGYKHDFAPLLGRGDNTTQNFSTYTIGFGEGAATTLLQETADDHHGHGAYYDAKDQEALYGSLQAALNDILFRLSSGTSAAVLSTSRTTTDKMFRAMFHPKGWRGFLECYTLPIQAGASPLWEAGSLLRTRRPGDRSIFTATSATPTSREVFDTSNLSLTPAILGVPRRERTPLIRYIRGGYQSSWGYRDRDPDQTGGDQWKLGDIVDSTPVVRALPRAFWDTSASRSSSGVSDYATFRSHRQSRKPLVIVGANDGMLHAFNVSDGSEAWAFIPYNLLGSLKNLSHEHYAHTYYVDLTPAIADCKIGGGASGDKGWHTLLLAGERQGGHAYFALDITGDVDEGYPIPMWNFTDSDLGETWSVPQIGLVTDGGASRYRWMGVFGSGYVDTGFSDKKGYLYGVDMANGSLIFKIKVDDSGGNVLASPTLIDVNDDTRTDRIYVGDMLGRMWKGSIPGGGASHTTVQPLISLGATQPIRVRPSLSFFDRTNGQVMAVYFGTGRFDTAEDKKLTDTQSFYCVLDEGTLPVSKTDLVNVDSPGIRGYCSSHGKLPSGKRGWYYDLPNPGERVIASSLLMGGIVFFTTFTPNNDVCGYGGVARLYALKYDTGCAPEQPVLDVNGDNIVDATDTVTGQPGGAVPKSMIIGHGLPSAPVYDAGNGQVIVQTSDTTLHARKVSLPKKGFEIQYWREILKNG